MGKRIIDVLAPYEDEVLVSWIVRMLRMYKGIKLDTYTDEVMRDLFGPTSTAKPGLYLQNGLQYFCNNCGIKDSTVFGSEEMMYEKLSVIPFYYSFCSEEQKERVKKRHVSKKSCYSYVENIIGIRSAHSYVEGKSYYKFCPECMKLQKEPYLKREHQIQGNVVCSQHGCVLYKIPYSSTWKDIDYSINLYDDKNVTSYELTELEYAKALGIAEMVHDIFLNGFKDNIYILKEKIMHKLKDLDIISCDGKFYNLEDFIEVLDARYLYKHVSIKSELISAVFVSPRIPNPIIYLILIQYLFGSLDDYYAYKYKEGSAVSVKYSDILNETIEKRNHELSFYMSNLPKWFEKEYVVLGETKDNIVIKHLTCGTIFKRTKKVRKLTKCFFCMKKKVVTDISNGDVVSNNETIYYVSTSEYGKLHGKMEKQIRNLCNENRIPGVIRAGKDILIPIDAPYPKDLRYKKKSK